MKVIPAIDLRGGRCVRLYQGEFDRETEYSSDPRTLARTYTDFGAQWLHVVDLDGARDGVQANRDLVALIAAESAMNVQLGGGIRSRETVEAWLDAGVGRCVIGSLAVTAADEVREWLREAGADSIVLALDVRIAANGVPYVSTHGWRETSGITLDACIEGYLSSGLRHVLCTDVSRDGAMRGPNFELYSDIMRKFPDIELQASGGVRNLDDLIGLRATGAAAAITGRALLDGSLLPEEVRSFQHDA